MVNSIEARAISLAPCTMLCSFGVWLSFGHCITFLSQGKNISYSRGQSYQMAWFRGVVRGSPVPYTEAIWHFGEATTLDLEFSNPRKAVEVFCDLSYCQGIFDSVWVLLHLQMSFWTSLFLYHILQTVIHFFSLVHDRKTLFQSGAW